MKNQLYFVISVLTVVVYFLPLAIVAIRKLWNEISLLVFAVYWAISGLINLVDIIPELPENLVVTISILYNMLDIPLVIAIFCFTSRIPGLQKFSRIVLPVYLLALCINPFIQGLNYDALKYLIGAGLILIFTIIIWDIVSLLRKLEHSSGEKAKLVIDAALLFQYGTYVIIYIFDYFYIKASNETDNFIIYYISSIIALSVGSTAFLIVKKQDILSPRKKIRTNRNLKSTEDADPLREDSVYTSFREG